MWLLAGAASRATVTRCLKSSHSLAWSFTAIRSGIGLWHGNRVAGSKCAHCLQQWRAAPHLGQLPFQSTSAGSAIEQLKQRAATTFCKSRGRRGPVTSMGGLGPVRGPAIPILAVGIHITALSILTVVVHVSNRLLD